MGIVVLKMDKEQGTQIQNYKEYMIQRDVELELILEPGSYIIVPRTSGCTLRRPENAEAESLKLMDQSGKFHPYFSSAIDDLFKKFDLVVSNTI